MMRSKRVGSTLALMFLLVALAVVPASATQVPWGTFANAGIFTGNAAADRAAMVAAPNITFIGDINDPVGDAGPAGFDIRRVHLGYDAIEDALYVVVDCVGRCGDSDGVPGAGPIDAANFGTTPIDEAFVFAFDTDNDCTLNVLFGGVNAYCTPGDFDYVVAVAKDVDLTAFDLHTYNNTGLALDNTSNYGPTQANMVGYLASPDDAVTGPAFVFAIKGWSTLFTGTGSPTSFTGKFYMDTQLLGAEEVAFDNPITAIDLESFSAAADGSTVNVAWKTGTEIDNAGFNVYRASAADGPYSKINGQLIAATGSEVSGGSYSYSDTPGAGTSFYKLEDVDTSGVATVHGPVSVEVSVFGAQTKKLYLPAIAR